jgi:large subunit ribosomal protein L16
MAILLPAKTKYRKVQKGRVYGNAKGGDTLAFGDFGIQVVERGQITAAQLEAARVAINRHLKRKGKMWMRVFPQKPITQKPAETRMGKGKGNVEYWVAVAKPGAILFELAGISFAMAREAMSLADRKLGLRCRFLSREALMQRF